MARRGPGWEALTAASPRLRCPVCLDVVSLHGQALRCSRGHSFDVARQGHVVLRAAATGRLARGDDPAMIAARAELLASGHYDRLADAITGTAAAVAPARPAGGWVADFGCGTGFHLARVLDRLPGWRGLGLDASTAGLRHAVHAHVGIAGIGCDLWRELPLADGTADLGLDVFAPRNADEYARVLAPDGALVVVTPAPDHLRELAGLPGMPRVDPIKDQRLAFELSSEFAFAERREVAYVTKMEVPALRAVVGMGPGAYHLAPAVLDSTLPAGGRDVTVAARIDVYRPRRRAGG